MYNIIANIKLVLYIENLIIVGCVERIVLHVKLLTSESMFYTLISIKKLGGYAAKNTSGREGIYGQGENSREFSMNCQKESRLAS